MGVLRFRIERASLRIVRHNGAPSAFARRRSASRLPCRTPRHRVQRPARLKSHRYVRHHLRNEKRDFGLGCTQSELQSTPYAQRSAGNFSNLAACLSKIRDIETCWNALARKSPGQIFPVPWQMAASCKRAQRFRRWGRFRTPELVSITRNFVNQGPFF